MTVDWEEYMKTCSEETSKDVLQAIVSATQLQEKDDLTWVTALSDSPKLLETDQNKDEEI